MNDKELIKAMAELWVANGGDAEGLDWCLQDLKNAVASLIIKEITE